MTDNPFAFSEKIRELVMRSGATCASWAWNFDDMDSGSSAWGDYEFEGKRFGTSSMAFYDLASITKTFTATGILLLRDRGKLRLDDPVQQYLPDFARSDVTLRHLLSHTSMLDLYLSDVRATNPAPEAVHAAICASGRREGDYFYQDPNMIVLGWVIEKVTGLTLDAFMYGYVFAPLGMDATGFGVQDASRRSHTMPTFKPSEGATNPGVVHDPTARILGGVAGHAGIFSTVNDLVTFAQMWNKDGLHEGRQFLRPETVRDALTPVYTSKDGHFAQGLGWKQHSPREQIASFVPGAWMHGGFTGTFMMFCEKPRLEFVLLTDFVYPGERTLEERNKWWESIRVCAMAAAKEAQALSSGT